MQLEPYSTHTYVDPKRLAEELVQIRNQGHAGCLGGVSDDGLATLATPPDEGRQEGNQNDSADHVGSHIGSGGR